MSRPAPAGLSRESRKTDSGGEEAEEDCEGVREGACVSLPTASDGVWAPAAFSPEMTTWERVGAGWRVSIPMGPAAQGTPGVQSEGRGALPWM